MSSQRISRPDSLGLTRPPPQDQYPEDDASIYILFDGLMCFAYKAGTPEVCEIGLHANSPIMTRRAESLVTGAATELMTPRDCGLPLYLN